jgi:hypothetical protein
MSNKVHLVDKHGDDHVDFELSHTVEKDAFTEIFNISSYQDGTSMRKLIALGGEQAIAL